MFFDGAMGTMLQNSGLLPGELPELLNITSPDTIINIHRAYLDAGSDTITTNTFGANRIKLQGSSYSPSQVISAAVTNAKKAISN
ncbi:MAG: homocysteine methyltransferase, partial [Clostridiales bacterium]|nr:homocysteine methyltransferase [Clostridiales bacterium]